MRKTILAVAVWLAVLVPAGQSFAGGRVQARKPGEPAGQRAAVLHAMRSRGIVQPAHRLNVVSGIDGGSRTFFFARGVSKRVTRTGALPGELERVNVIGEVKRSSKNKSGWSVTMKTDSHGVHAPPQTLQE